MSNPELPDVNLNVAISVVDKNGLIVANISPRLALLLLLTCRRLLVELDKENQLGQDARHHAQLIEQIINACLVVQPKNSISA